MIAQFATAYLTNNIRTFLWETQLLSQGLRPYREGKVVKNPMVLRILVSCKSNIHNIKRLFEIYIFVKRSDTELNEKHYSSKPSAHTAYYMINACMDIGHPSV